MWQPGRGAPDSTSFPACVKSFGILTGQPCWCEAAQHFLCECSWGGTGELVLTCPPPPALLTLNVPCPTPTPTPGLPWTTHRGNAPLIFVQVAGERPGRWPCKWQLSPAHPAPSAGLCGYSDQMHFPVRFVEATTALTYSLCT